MWGVEAQGQASRQEDRQRGWGVPIPVNQTRLQEGGCVGRAGGRGGAVKLESRKWGPVSAQAR